MRVLDDDERTMLDIESQHWRWAALKEQAIRERLGVTAARYYQRLARLIDEPAAWAYAPATVRRLRDARPQRRLG